MKINHILLISLLIVGALFVPAVSAEELIWDYTVCEFTDTSGTVEKPELVNRGTRIIDKIYMVDISLHETFNNVVFTIPSTNVGYNDDGSLLDSGRHEFTYALKNQGNKPLIVYIDRFLSSTRITMFFEHWDIEALSGAQVIDINGMYFMNAIEGEGAMEGSSLFTQNPIMITNYNISYFLPKMPVRVDWTSGIEWQNHIKVNELDPNPLGGYEFSLTRKIDGKYSQSICNVYNNEEIIFTDSSTTDIVDKWFSTDIITQINIESPTGRVYKFPVAGSTDPGEQTGLRKGSVTMTDDNGMTIRGFEVTAVNHYTGEEYTVSTDTDVAVIELPMDRTIDIRNPQTGEYEESPVGYYRFFGQSPGYKMLFDDGIQVRVMPEKYGSYKFCDIGVTSENGFTSTLRRGTVTMTDHNGTSITGFEVTAVNAYTGEEYTVATDTNVAVMDLPMDRTTEIRNPQTGVYEEAPVGYYRFYGQAPGYEMLNEEGIRVMVMPEKYGSYKICDILVTSESGPLSGKHQFQIRSRGDNSVLQTGTISAQSETTGIWYNTTLTNGIATLLLPYDTSDALSEYAGHYYVYATSPGYEDSDYGTRIIVSPRTTSEIKTILLTPIGGVPTPGNVTLRIEAFSETGQDVPNAEIFIAGVLGAGKDVWDTYTASSTGYLEVSVPGNSTYNIVARGAGYYDSSRRIEVLMDDPPLIEIKLYLSGAPTVEPTTEPTGWPTVTPTTQPTGGIPDEDDDSDGFMVQAVRSIANLFGVSFGIGKTILGMLIALAIGTATAKQLKGGAQEFGMGMLGGVVLGVLIGLLPIWVLVLLLLIIGLWIGYRYMSGGDS